MNRRVRRGVTLTSLRVMHDYLAVQRGSLEHEAFGVMLSDTRLRMIECVALLRGSPRWRERASVGVCEARAREECGALILCHPDPPGVAEP